MTYAGVIVHIGRTGGGSPAVCGSRNARTSGLSVRAIDFEKEPLESRCKRCQKKLPTYLRLAHAKSRRDPARQANFARIRPIGVWGHPKRTGGLRVRTITDVLGRKRKARLYADGSYNCPFCNYGVQPKRKWCDNPACSASKYAKGKFNQTPERIRQGEAAHKAREAEEARRKRDHESAMRRGAEAQEERWQKATALITEARKRGACVSCLNTSGYGPVKFVKHRGPCPKRQR